MIYAGQFGISDRKEILCLGKDSAVYLLEMQFSWCHLMYVSFIFVCSGSRECFILESVSLAASSKIRTGVTSVAFLFYIGISIDLQKILSHGKRSTQRPHWKCTLGKIILIQRIWYAEVARPIETRKICYSFRSRVNKEGNKYEMCFTRNYGNLVMMRFARNDNGHNPTAKKCGISLRKGRLE